MRRIIGIELTFLLAAFVSRAVISADFVLANSNSSPIQWIHLSSKTGGIPAPGPSNEQTASLVLDVDKDGLNDFIIAAQEQGPAVLWYRRDVTGWTRYIIDSSPLSIEAGGASLDIDGDEDLDIILGGNWHNNKVWWWENPYPNYDPNIPWTRREIKSSGADKHHDQLVGDFDGDGKLELVFWVYPT